VAARDGTRLVHQGGRYARRFEAYVERFRACDRALNAAPVDDDRDGASPCPSSHPQHT